MAARRFIQLRTFLLIVGIAFAVPLNGCRRNFANENDTLRAKVVELESQVDQLKKRNAELEAQVTAATSMPTTAPEDIRLNTPQVVEVSIESLSFVRDADHDGIPDTLTIYLNPADGLGRFTQMVGSIDVNASIVPVKGDPVSIARRSLTPAEVREAYRSGLTGTHYTIEVPIRVPAGLTDTQCVVGMEFHDGLTGRTLAAQRNVPLK